MTNEQPTLPMHRQATNATVVLIFKTISLIMIVLYKTIVAELRQIGKKNVMKSMIYYYTGFRVILTP